MCALPGPPPLQLLCIGYNYIIQTIKSLINQWITWEAENYKPMSPCCVTDKLVDLNRKIVENEMKHLLQGSFPLLDDFQIERGGERYHSTSVSFTAVRVRLKELSNPLGFLELSITVKGTPLDII